MSIEQIMQLANVFSTVMKQNDTNESNQENKEEKKYVPLVFDEELQTQDMKVIKAVIPFMDLSRQKTLGVMVKLMEIERLLSKNESVEITAMMKKDKEEWYKDVLMAVKPHCTEEKQQMLDNMVRLFEMKKILIQAEELKKLI